MKVKTELRAGYDIAANSVSVSASASNYTRQSNSIGNRADIDGSVYQSNSNYTSQTATAAAVSGTQTATAPGDDSWRVSITRYLFEQFVSGVTHRSAPVAF